MRLLLILCFALTFLACNKNANILSDKEKLSSQSWEMVKVLEKPGTINPNADHPTADITCEKKGTLELLPNGNISSSLIEGNCITSSVYSDFLWEYFEEEKRLRLTRESNAMVFDYYILEISTKKLTLYIQRPEALNGTGIVDIYYFQAK